MAERWAGAIQSPADVRRVLDSVNRDGLTRANTTALAEAVRPAADVQPDTTQLLPAPDQLTHLLPWGGLRRGSTVAVTGSASLLLTLLATAMGDSSWAAVVGMPDLGMLAAGQDHGIPLERLALVPEPGPDWPTVVAALLDGVDLVVVQAPAGVSDGVIRSLQARARQRGSVLIPTTAWSGADVVLTATSRQWHGLSEGRGRLLYQELQVASDGRGRAGRTKTATVVLPAEGKPAPLVIPPPPGLGAEPEAVESPLWAHVVPNEPPPDRWAGLTVVASTKRNRR